jgi:hypothetical protein
MNLLEMAEEEHRLVREGIGLHGDFYENAAATTVAFSNLIGHPIADCESFIRFHAKAKKHHTLAVLSAVRRHRAQASLNLRSYLEATVQAAFALANPDVSNFFDLTKMLPVDEQKVMRRAYKWLAGKYPPSNESIKGIKDRINATDAHASFTSSQHHFQFDPTTRAIHTPFFDLEDVQFVNFQLHLCAQAGLIGLDLILAARNDFGCFLSARDIDQIWSNLTHQNDTLQQRLLEEPRWVAASQAAGATGDSR